MSPYPSFYQNATGCTNYYNYLTCQVSAAIVINSYMLNMQQSFQPERFHSCAPQEPEDQGYFSPFVTLPQVRRAIHVGNLTFHSGAEVEKHLLEDVMKSVKPWLSVLMDNYRVSEQERLSSKRGEFSSSEVGPCIQVLMYSGQLDVIVAAPLTERFLLTVNWTGAADYRTAPRFHWKVQPGDTEVAGYVRQVKEFYQVRR